MFLTEANPFAHSTEKLAKLAENIHRYLPQIKTIGCFSRVTDITPKSVSELKELRLLGYDGIIIGTETGDDEALAFMWKGYKAADIVRELHKLQEAGIGYQKYAWTVKVGEKGSLLYRKKRAMFLALTPAIR